MRGLWVRVGAGHVLCLLFLLEPSFFPGRGEARFPSGEEGRQKREIQNSHPCLVNTIYSAEQSSRREGLRER